MRRAGELELALGPRPRQGTLMGWLYAELRGAVLSGRLAPGRRLPSTRDLARQQGVSRGTVLAVYEQLIAEGYLTGATGSGTTVSATLPIVPQRDDEPPEPSGPTRFSRLGARLAASPFPRDEATGPARPFRPNQPDVGAFPLALWRRLTHRYGRGRLAEEMGYGDAAGYLPLRRAIADHLHYSQRIACHAGQVVVFASAQQALDLCARLLLDPEDAALVEDPGYPGAAAAFALTGAEVLGQAVDADGLCLEPALPLAENIRLAYVTAAHQSPLGGVLPLERRLSLLAWAEACDAMIVEDDYDGEYRFDGAPLPALKSLDRNGRVIYMGTFSKLLFPALRLAYLVVPEGLADAFASALSQTVRHVPQASQAVLAAFIAEGHFARHLRQMRQRYGARAATFQEECRRRLDGLLTVLPIATGLDATAILPAGADDAAVAAALTRAGIEARPVSFYRRGLSAPPGLVLGFSAFDRLTTERGVAGMAAVLDGLFP